MPAAAEPASDRLANPVLRYLLATRPPFLAASLVPALIGLASVHHTGMPLNPWTALLTVAGILVIHGGVNVLNDYYDSRNGTDAINTERVFPYTGGSRFIQNGVISQSNTARYGAGLLAAGVIAGIWLSYFSGPALLAIGAVGLFLGWAYTAPPWQLVSRGLGELAVGAGFGLLIPLGTWYVQTGSLDPMPLAAGLPYAFLVTNILFINQFPDLRADARVGKHHWVVRLGAGRARWLYPLLTAAALLSLVVTVVTGLLPARTLAAAVALVLSASASVTLLRHAQTPARLGPALKATIGAATGFGLLLSGLLWI